MYEELLGEDEVHPDQVYEKIYVGKTSVVDNEILIGLIERFEELNKPELKDELLNLIQMDREFELKGL